MRITELVGRPVLDLATARTIGAVDDAVVDPASGHLTGLLLRKTPGRATWLDWEHVKAVGADAVTVPDVAALRERPEQRGRLLRGDSVIGGRVLSDHGVGLAHLADIDIDPADGRVYAFVLVDGTTVAAADVLAIGRYATVVRHPGQAPAP